MSFCYDNDKVQDVALAKSFGGRPSFSQMNDYISKTISGITCGSRFSGQTHGNLLKSCTNLVCFPRLHFFSVAYAPLNANQIDENNPIVNTIQKKEHYLTDINIQKGRILTTSGVFRGNYSPIQIPLDFERLKAEQPEKFVQWISLNHYNTYCDVLDNSNTDSVTHVVNHTGIVQLIQKNLDKFNSMFKRKAFLASFSNIGMDEMEFVEAQYNSKDLVAEYQQYAEAK
eukprot:TRINITY_DN855_c0_g1_i4.p1 TRINITY_DN855_c0_g1~~TRINITY_DN855_c0_g1_i4.p1  ORF type:complete len:228 (+),score=27.32 TRINITY_DN855_c0_g1_i4:713-1396(+)